MNAEVKIFDQTTGALAAYFSNRIVGGGAILALDYELLRQGGCGELNLKANRVRQGGSVSCGNLVEVWTQSDDEARGRRYRGIVNSIEEDFAAQTTEIKAWGFWAQFDWQIVVDYIEGAAITSIVNSIFSIVQPNTYCSATPRISLASPATIADIEIDFQNATEIIKKLAEIQGNVDYGVDADGVFYFTDSSATKVGHFQLGVNLSELKSSERSDEICNDIFIKTRGLVSAGNLILHEADPTSVGKYKKRSTVVDSPELTSIDDAIAWAQSKIDATKTPAKQYSFKPIIRAKKHIPFLGTVELANASGASAGTFSVESVKYAHGHSGLVQELTVGDWNGAFDASKMFSDLERKIRIMDASNISNSKIQHSGFDEFNQYVQQNALSSGLYNIFSDDLAQGSTGIIEAVIGASPRDVNGRNTYDVTGARIKGPKTAIRVDSRLLPAIIQTVAIPSGRLLDTVRLYYSIDSFGRYTFTDSAALQDWNNTGCSDNTLGGFSIDTANGYLVGNPALASANRGKLYLKPKSFTRSNQAGDQVEAFYEQDTADSIRLKLDDLPIYGTIGDIVFKCRFNYKPLSSLSSWAEFYVEVIGDNSYRFHLDSYIVDVLTHSDTSDQDYSNNYIVRLGFTSDPAECVIVSIYDNEMNILDYIKCAMTWQTSRKFRIETMKNSEFAGETGRVGLEWMDIYRAVQSDRVRFDLSRDGGTTWTQYIPPDSQGSGYHDVSLASQPTGDRTLILKATLYWPAMLYGVGLAWGGDA